MATAPTASTDPQASASVVIAGERFPTILKTTSDEEISPAAIILLDDDTPDRIEAVERYWRALRSGAAPTDQRLTRQRRRRLRQMIQAVDGHQAGATYRDIAAALFNDAPGPASAWVGDAVRETTIRLVRDGLDLVMGGYRKLLRRARRP